MTKMKVKKLKINLTGITVPKDPSQAGLFVEHQLSANGYSVQKGPGPDLEEYGVEVKTRGKDSISPHTIGSMKRLDIINTHYNQSMIKDKMQQQYRVLTQHQTVIKDHVVDFSSRIVQEKLRTAYEAGRSRMAKGAQDNYVPGTYWGYFEKRPTGDSYIFRIHDHAMKQLETMSRLTWNSIFEEQND